MSEQEQSAPVDLHRVLVEIEDEVRAKRASGELPADLEKELDNIFARLSPAGAVDGDFDQLLERAESQSFVDLVAPNDSARPGVPHVKRVVQKTVRWYLRYVTEQFGAFANTTLKALRGLGARVTDLEQLVAPGDELASVIVRHKPDVDTQWRPLIVATLRGTEGRVLHCRCGAGALVRDLKEAGIDAYGVDPASELVAVGTGSDALDLRPDDERAHLRTLSTASLGGLVLTGAPDVLASRAQIELADLASVTLAPAGTLLLLVANPMTWSRARSRVEADLAPGRPMHAETWEYLLTDRGFSSVEVHKAPSGAGLAHVPGSDEMSAAINANLDRINEVLFPAPVVMIVARRASSR